MAGTARALTLVAAIGAGLAAGVFVAFSTFVMRALGRLPDAQGLSAMQAINRAAPAPLIMSLLFGTAAAWRHYLGAWTAWNHVRALTSLAAAVTFTLAYRAG